MPGRGRRRARVHRARGASRQLRGPRPVLIARILIWGLADSLTTIEELRHHLPELADGDRWVSNGVTERFGLITFADELPDLGELTQLIGKEPDVVDEFDVE